VRLLDICTVLFINKRLCYFCLVLFIALIVPTVFRSSSDPIAILFPALGGKIPTKFRFR